MNNKAADARLAHQIAQERDREERRLLRDRREELYVSLETWLAGLEQYIMLGLRLGAGKLSYNQHLDLQLEQGQRSKLDLPRLKMLLDVYGSAAIKQDYLKVTSLLDAVNQAVFAIEGFAKRSTDTKERDRSFDTLHQLAAELRDSGKTLLASVATAITSDRKMP